MSNQDRKPHLAPSDVRVIYYDYEHCREFLERRALELREQARGIEMLALYRELYYSFSYEALEQNAITLGQFDPGVVYVFIPQQLTSAKCADGNKIAREKAIEMLPSNHPPVVMELISAQKREPIIGERGRMERWMRAEFLEEVVNAQKVCIHMYFDGAGFFEQVMKPRLEELKFEVIDTYVNSAKQEFLRVRHPSTPGKVVKIPWLLWVREMMGGGYSPLYAAACFVTYLQKMQAAVHGAVGSSR